MKRLSVLFTVFLTACLPMRGESPSQGIDACETQPPSAREAAAWQRATSRNTRDAYRDFLMSYPRSCYAVVATERMRAAPRPAPVTVRRITSHSPEPSPSPY